MTGFIGALVRFLGIALTGYFANDVVKIVQSGTGPADAAKQAAEGFTEKLKDTNFLIRVAAVAVLGMLAVLFLILTKSQRKKFLP